MRLVKKPCRVLVFLSVATVSLAWAVGVDGAEPPCSAKHDDFDLDTTGGTDPNGLPLDAVWSYQKANPGSYPNPETCCGGFPDNFPRGKPQCTSQSVSIDGPNFGHKFFCDFGTSNFSGHLNWTLATYEGFLTWESHESAFFGDDDYTLNLKTRAGVGLTSNNTQGLHVEMNGDETIDQAQVGWWAAFRRANDSTKYTGGTPSCTPLMPSPSWSTENRWREGPPKTLGRYWPATGATRAGAAPRSMRSAGFQPKGSA